MKDVEELRKEGASRMRALGMMKKVAREFEKEFGVSVYHVVLTNCEFGRVYSFLYVGDEEDGNDWEAEREMLAHGQCPAWCENRDEPMFSEFGYVGVRSVAGGLDRTW